MSEAVVGANDEGRERIALIENGAGRLAPVLCACLLGPSDTGVGRDGRAAPIRPAIGAFAADVTKRTSTVLPADAGASIGPADGTCSRATHARKRSVLR